MRVLKAVMLAAAMVLGALPGAADYVSGLDLRGVETTLTGQTGAATGAVALRVSPSQQGAVVMQLRDGAGAIVLAEVGGWLRVLSEDGATGYVIADRVAIGAPPEPLFTQASSGKGDASTAGTSLQAWQTYVNARFGSVIDYPADIFRPDAAPANGDGNSFHSVDGRADFIVYGQNNVFNQTLADLQQEDMEVGGYRVTYDRVGPDWYALSGYVGPRVFYRKVLLRQGGNVVHVFHMTYPEADKPRLDPVASRMSRSFDAS